MQVLMGKRTAFLAFLLASSMPAIAESIPRGPYPAPNLGTGWQLVRTYCSSGGDYCPDVMNMDVTPIKRNHSLTEWARYVGKRGKIHFIETVDTYLGIPSHISDNDVPKKYAVNCDLWEAKGMAWRNYEADKEWFTISPDTLVDRLAKIACK